MRITFKSDTKKRKRFFTPEHFAHPAKMHLGLALWIIGKYTKPGEVILDPMAGAGTTMIACTLGRNVILVDLEEKFVKMMQDNWDKLKADGNAIGDCQILQGDARQLEGLLVDKIVTSPPYAVHQVQDPVFYAKAKMDMEGRDISKENASSRADPENPSNIGNLPYGQIDKIVTSPPYAIPKTTRGSLNAQEGKVYQDTRRGRKGTGWEFSGQEELGHPSPENIANLHYGNIDSIITSPPYEEALGKKHHSPRADKLAQEKSNPVTYTDRVDAVITSPPYEGSLQGEPSEERIEIRAKYFEETDIKQGRKPGSRHTPGRMKHLKVVGSGYSPNVDNIGNLKSDSYLSAMLQVYQQCYKVLKPDGLMILVTKDFIRNKQRVLLSIDTLKLCERAGFVLEDWHERVLTQQSFWRVIYKKKYPDAPTIDTEDVLVFKKPKEGE